MEPRKKPSFQRGDSVRIVDDSVPKASYVVMAVDSWQEPPKAQIVQKGTGFPKIVELDKLRHCL